MNIKYKLSWTRLINSCLQLFYFLFNLTVRARFPRNESKVDARVGEDIALNCSAEGYPLNITWKKSKSGLSSVIKGEKEQYTSL